MGASKGPRPTDSIVHMENQKYRSWWLQRPWAEGFLWRFPSRQNLLLAQAAGTYSRMIMCVWGGLLPTSSQSIYYLGDEAKVMGMFKHGGVEDTILCRVLYKGDWW